MERKTWANPMGIYQLHCLFSITQCLMFGDLFFLVIKCLKKHTHWLAFSTLFISSQLVDVYRPIMCAWTCVCVGGGGVSVSVCLCVCVSVCLCVCLI